MLMGAICYWIAIRQFGRAHYDLLLEMLRRLLRR
jgi:hypothetical protein